MNGLDTNFLVRYIVRDDPRQTSIAAKTIEAECTETEPGFISLATILETVWVLGSSYDFSNIEIALALNVLLRSRTLHIQNEREVYAAMVALKTGTGSFGDALIGALGQWAGCKATLTFDRKAARLAGFRWVS